MFWVMVGCDLTGCDNREGRRIIGGGLIVTAYSHKNTVDEQSTA